ncbi:hypothetical protein KC332_g14837 [Hortaea werneckii]|uniref:RING-type domain-containing protein n=2 Tax=Hortaea werneckii TaxID=91943 RepID=A0A3M7IHH8_HORWE|nr:hypothetical protein KC358_g14831 [Hortaea werneckii]OTA30340.1 hypothetical protein BTJ68_09316 [Hortaea werneckii EXF-2000]KAI6906522.1 hypothetical protein KC348_g14617 [Hortaea werneckii]KAI6924063.1 hypothetical protein KC341_g14279 [Hortaea werneckii]KAI6957056.1 hypothetical protein KC321_g14814 [Hortaea werneckii]
MENITPGFVHPEGNTRKRLKISRSPPRASPAAQSSAMASSSAVPVAGNSLSRASHGHSGPCQHETALKTLHSDISAMRDLVTCQICHRFMYEPYALSCGHTYCYTCLSQWLGSNKKKTCPDCRMVITQQPTPSYIIRELVLVFLSRNELLPDGETSDEHHSSAREEAEIVSKDKANTDSRTGGLFKGIFRHGGGPLNPIFDPHDRVERCPDCHWEIEDGYCNGCGQPVGEGFSEFDDDDSDMSSSEHDDLDQDVDAHDDESVFGARDDFDGQDHFGSEDDVDPAVFRAAFRAPATMFGRVGRAGRGGRTRSPAPVSSDVSDDDSDHPNEYDPDMEGFIDDDTQPIGGIYDDESDDTEVQQASSRPRQRNAHIVISDDEDERPSMHNGGPTAGADDSGDDDDDEGPVAAGSQRNKRSNNATRRRPRTAISISGDDDDSDDDDSDDDEDSSSDSTEDENDDDDDDDATQQEGGLSPVESDASALYHEGIVPIDYWAPPGDAPAWPIPNDIPMVWGDEEGPDDYEGNSDNGDNGWASARTEHPTLPQNHRLGTGMQHRSRHSSIRPADASRFSPSATGARSHHHSSRAAPRRPAPTHPFNLDSTLATINRNVPIPAPTARPRDQGRRMRRRYREPSIDRSSDEESLGISGGDGVEVGPAASGSSGGSSQTLGRSQV